MKQMNTTRRQLLLSISGAAIGLMSGAAYSQVLKPWQDWQLKTDSDNPFMGKIWSVGAGDIVTPGQMIADIERTKYVVIGEVHDNPDHHLLQAWIIERLAEMRKPAVVMEMIDAGQAPALAAYMAKPDANAEGLGPAIDWQSSGWPQWSMYQPIAEAIFMSGLKLLAGNPAKSKVRDLSRQGLKSIELSERQRLALDETMTEELVLELNNEIISAHCDLLPDAMIAPMVGVQRFRDAMLADATINAANGQSDNNKQAILITGNGHARADRAVPWYLARQDISVKNGSAKISTVMLIEAGEHGNEIKDMIVTDPGGNPAADYFWFTPRVQRDDPCEALRKQFKK